MRGRLLLLLPFALGACTLLVQFVDTPCDGGCADASLDVGIDVKDAASEGADAGPGFDASKVCIGEIDGYYCGFNGLSAPPNDLIHCVDGSAIVRDCDGGCLAFPSGTADRCNECPGIPNGNYCGSQFPTYGASNAPFLISCDQGIAAIQVDCVNGCQPGPGDASCK